MPLLNILTYICKDILKKTKRSKKWNPPPLHQSYIVRVYLFMWLGGLWTQIPRTVDKYMYIYTTSWGLVADKKYFKIKHVFVILSYIITLLKNWVCHINVCHCWTFKLTFVKISWKKRKQIILVWLRLYFVLKLKKGGQVGRC